MTRESMFVALRRRWWVIVVLTVLGGILGAVPAPQKAVDSTTTWSASHTLLVDSTAVSQFAGVDQVLFNQLQLFATTGEVPKRAAEKLAYPGGGSALATQVEVTGRPEQASLVISTTQDSADAAVAIPNAIADELVNYLAERQDALREQRLATTLSRLETLEKRLKELSAKAAFAPTDAVLQAKVEALSRQYSVAFELYDSLRTDDSQLVLTTVGRAEAIAQEQPGLSAPRSRLVRGILGGIVGFAAGIVAALVLARLDRRIRTVEQAEAIFGVHAQLAIPYVDGPDSSAVAVQHDRHDGLSDSYRRLRSLVSFIENGLELPAGDAPITVVVSAGPSEGKTSITANLAAAIKESGSRVVAVNTDFRRPTLATRLAGRRHPNGDLDLSDVAETALEDLVTPDTDDAVSVFDLAGIDASPGDLARATRKELPELRRLVDSIVVDTSPIGATAEVLELIPAADIVIVAVRPGHTSLEAATRAADTLRALSHAEVLLVLVGVDGEKSGAYYYEYGSGSGRTRRSRRRT